MKAAVLLGGLVLTVALAAALVVTVGASVGGFILGGLALAFGLATTKAAADTF